MYVCIYVYMYMYIYIYICVCHGLLTEDYHDRGAKKHGAMSHVSDFNCRLHNMISHLAMTGAPISSPHE